MNSSPVSGVSSPVGTPRGGGSAATEGTRQRSEPAGRTPDKVARERIKVTRESTPRRSGSWLPFVMVVLAILAVTVAGLLALTSTLATKSFEFYEIKTENEGLQRQHQELTKEVAELESLARLEEAARESGLVPAGTPGFVRLADGTVGGDPTRATPPPPVPAWGDNPGYPIPEADPEADAEADAEPDGKADAEGNPAGSPGTRSPDNAADGAAQGAAGAATAEGAAAAEATSEAPASDTSAADAGRGAPAPTGGVG